jgi:hypothetical protein
MLCLTIFLFGAGEFEEAKNLQRDFALTAAYQSYIIHAKRDIYMTLDKKMNF